MPSSSKRETAHRLVPTKQNRPIEDAAVELWGAMRGTVTVLVGTDLTAPTGEAWEAES